MGERLKADLDRITEVSVRLGMVEREFGQASAFAADNAAFGSPVLASAVDSFANGWSKHRAALIADLAQVAHLSSAAVASYNGTDEKLAEGLRKAEKSS